MAHMDMGWALAVQGLNQNEKSVLFVLTCHADRQTGQTFVSQPVIAREAGMSPTSRRTVRTAIKNLERYGLISRKGRVQENGRQTSDLITVHYGTLPNLGTGANSSPRANSPYGADEVQGLTAPGTGANSTTNKEPNRALSLKTEKYLGTAEKESSIKQVSPLAVESFDSAQISTIPVENDDFASRMLAAAQRNRERREGAA